MQKICDIYLATSTSGTLPCLKQLTIFKSDITFDDHKFYFGFVGLNIKRIIGVSILSQLKKNNVKCFNIPIEYRENKLMTEDEALEFLKKIYSAKGSISKIISRKNEHKNPMYWNFNISAKDDNTFEGGGIISVDALDGHIWNSESLEEYLYDYNNEF